MTELFGILFFEALSAVLGLLALWFFIAWMGERATAETQRQEIMRLQVKLDALERYYR